MMILSEKAFPILNDDFNPPLLSEDECRFLENGLRESDLLCLVEDLIIDKIEEHLRTWIVPEFWQEFQLPSIDSGFERFKFTVHKLHQRYCQFIPVFQRLEDMRKRLEVQREIYGEENLWVVLKYIITSTLQSQLPVRSHKNIVEEFYKLSFKVFYHFDKSNRDMNESGEDGLQCGGCSFELEQCRCEKIIEDFHSTNRILIELELLERIAGDVLTSLIHKQIETHIQDTCKGSFDVSFIPSLESWLSTVVFGWLTRLYSSGPDCPFTKKSLNTFKMKLNHLLYETYTKTRIEQLFNIIIEYPDSGAAIEDLKVCLEKTDLRQYLTTKLQNVLQTRLLHPGVNTSDIITAYVASIRALRHLDSTGILLETVTMPVRHYLRGRDDTMRCIVMSLTEDGPGELADELVRGEETGMQDPVHWEDWTPDPIDAHTKPNRERLNGRDIVSMLVTVYGSKEMFVHEYRSLLADRLLLQHSYNTEKEIRYLELLKLRFGDSQLHYCEVMLKDIYDSKRLNTHLHSEPNFGLASQVRWTNAPLIGNFKYATFQEFNCTCMILSAQFWPMLKEETLELPQKIKEHLNVYTKAFETLKGNRTLNWKPHLGSVDLEIELKGRSINLTVTPTQAAIIWYFQEKNQWTIDELSSTLLVPQTVLRRRIAFWQSQGLLRETSTDTFLLVEEPIGRSLKAPAASEMICEDDETESIMASAQDQREEELHAFWTYIVGMLGNLESLPPERIHQMLKMFASQGPSAVECTLQQLRHFLDQKVREHKLLFSGGFYRLPK
ncbi:anaphase-promoting complex subunit 2 isoform X2 [Cimex lectularius]|uniref:Anaphase-promoting complex subunit 2 n=1 Tax=Cimex lectularius TaxID=79782 RepID=A0A8I6SEQ3_CIMLE|nr:anaphase-promoting complex subunit 2 isoform X2 [Cimex lectularius]